MPKTYCLPKSLANIDQYIAIKQQTGVPDILDVGNYSPTGRNNWTEPVYTEAKISKLHSAGILCFCHIPTDWAYISYADVKKMVDYQMSIGPSIDGFFFDGTPNFYHEWGQYNTPPSPIPQRYLDLRAYVQGLGKQQINNIATQNMSQFTIDITDYVCVEFLWPQLITEGLWIPTNPLKFMGFSSQSDPAIAAIDTKAVFDAGIEIFGPKQEICDELVLWQQYANAMKQDTPTPPTPPEPPAEWKITVTTEPPTEEWKITVKPYRSGGWL